MEVEHKERELREEYRGNEGYLGRVIELDMIYDLSAVAIRGFLCLEAAETLGGSRSIFTTLTSTSTC